MTTFRSIYIIIQTLFPYEISQNYQKWLLLGFYVYQWLKPYLHLNFQANLTYIDENLVDSMYLNGSK